MKASPMHSAGYVAVKYSVICVHLFLQMLVGADIIKQKRLHIVTILNGDNPLFGYYAINPVYDTALVKLAQNYPLILTNVTRSVIHQAGLFSCPDGAAMIPLVSEKVSEAIQRYPDHFTVMFFPGCSMEVLALGDFAREWNVPLLAAISGDMTLGDKQRYPTVVTFPAPDHVTMPASFQLFLEKNRWRTVTFLCDALSQFQAVATFYLISCINIKRKLDTSTKTKYQTYKLDFDSKINQDYETLLRRTQAQSRVVIIFSHPRIIRDIMVTAYRLNMTGGDYIFFSSQTTRVPQTTDMLWEFHDGNDEAAYDGFRSLISFVNPNPNWDRIEDVLTEVKDITFKQYNKSITRIDQLNDLAISAYESMMALGQILNESIAEIGNLTGKQFAKKFWNRSFDFPSRSFSIGSNGMRINDVIYSRLNITSGIVQDTWRYYASSRALVELEPDLARTWKDVNGPPPDIPICGFHNDLCGTSNMQSAIIIGVSVAVAVLVVIGLGGIIYWKIVDLAEKRNLWWHIRQSDLTVLDKPTPAAQEMPLNASKVASQKKNAISSSRGLYQKQPVIFEQFYDKVLPPEKIIERKVVRQCLHWLKHFHQENLTRFLGSTAGTSPAGSCLIFEYGARGTLRMLLQNDRVPIDYSMQSSLVWEIINGLKFIHNSPLHHHGMLSSIGIMIDKRFCIKISSYALSKFRMQFCGHIFPVMLPLDAAILWAAPEIIAATKTSGSREGDIYSLGVIVSEIFTGYAPLSINLDNDTSISENITALREKPEKTRITDVSKMPAKLLEVILPCTANVPADRPNLTKLTGKLTHVLSRQKLVDMIMRRLEHYANDLENMVEARSRDLLEEQVKVDSLLKEMLPPSLINKLRNKETVNAENFDCVTILFSDIPQFGPICAQCAPLQTIVLLNTLYSLFDSVLHKFDVYKVETINDSYLLASGLPIRNGNRHAGEIARMGLSMRDATESICSPLETAEKLQLRVGINSGHCAAGVVGLRMPRYCLFGDTINTASRMESHGAVSKIHLSGTTKALLDELGGFQMESRGSIVIKVGSRK
ncbi:atrial natriuretic peptide receptor 1-like [Paramacrobiotus metropolitanus]|uniref:atrial natriuretic peptide receptor 1-like n=1 Tax=Paramacrobiotus metropolitanus TaxID=2943436 RepID=UPI002445F05C|nr:atrial natriuretic peptide receptor 1-like [Paramacrobiotus metropolitanus]